MRIPEYSPAGRQVHRITDDCTEVRMTGQGRSVLLHLFISAKPCCPVRSCLGVEDGHRRQGCAVRGTMWAGQAPAPDCSRYD